MSNTDLNNEKNPWKTLTTETVLENNWIKVVHHDVINPSGNEGIYDVVHFNGIAVGVIPMDDEGNIVLVGQYRYAIDQYSWEIPEGGGALGQDPLLAAKRELLEETGIKAKKYTQILEMHLSNSATDEYSVIYLAEDLSYHEAEPEETEELQIKKLPLDEVYNMVISGEITDSLTVAGILRLKLYLNEKIEKHISKN
ncbi:NUDIX hydrolase [bacterium]|nr:NUDIX hydrolase [bacterium]